MNNPKVTNVIKGVKVAMGVVSIVLTALEIKNTLMPGETPEITPDPAPEA